MMHNYILTNLRSDVKFSKMFHTKPNQVVVLTNLIY